jgi:hypothetical protein
MLHHYCGWLSLGEYQHVALHHIEGLGVMEENSERTGNAGTFSGR